MATEVIVSDKQYQSTAAPIADAAAEVPVSEVVRQFLEEQRHDYFSWQLIVFFAEHPYIRFNRLAVIHAMGQENGRHIQQALDELIEQGIIKVIAEWHLPLYCLAEDMRRIVIKLTRPGQK